MDDLLIVKAKDVLRMGRFRHLWALGWVVASAFLVVAGIQTARVFEADRRQGEIRELTHLLEAATVRQASVNESLMFTLEKQSQTADLLISWGNYVKARADAGRPNFTSQFAARSR